MEKILFSDSLYKNRSKNTALLASGFIFVLIALAHLLRLFMHVNINIAGYVLPMGVSFFALIVSLGLSVWMFSAMRD
jgi:hypothetical protein